MSVLPRRKSRIPILPPVSKTAKKLDHLPNTNPKVAVFAGSFDPLTFGHLDIINKASMLFDILYVIISINASKKTIFSSDQRINLIVSQSLPNNVKVESRINELTIKDCKLHGAKFLVRGVRNIIDFEYELTMSQLNHNLAPDIQTIFIPTTIENSIISSSAVKEIARFGGDISKYVPKNVAEELKQKLNGQNISNT